MSRLMIWLLIGIPHAFIMYVGFRVQAERLSLQRWVHVFLALTLWPVGVASTLCVLTGHRRASWWIERIGFLGMDALFDWWNLRQIRKLGAMGGPIPRFDERDE